MKILSFDPGKNNFAYAVVSSNQRCKKHGFVRSITTLEYNKLPDELTRFTNDISALLAEKPDLVIVERMQHRPKFGGGAVVEYINFMIGVLTELVRQHGCRIFLVSPPTWKSHYIKLYAVDIKKTPFSMSTQKMSVKAPKGSGKKTMTIIVKGVLDGQAKYDEELTPHEADAIGIGCYGWYMLTGIDIVRSVLA